MAGIPLCGASMLDILPDSITRDEKVRAAALALDEQLAKMCELAPALAIWRNLGNTTEPLLGTLAWQMHIDGAEGYELAENDEEKRALIANSIEAHRHKGTRWALERIAEILNMRLEIIEWWQTEPKGQPYTFHIDFVEVTRPIEPELYQKLMELVLELKNKRSWLDGLTVYLAARGTAYVGAATVFGAFVTVYPWQLEGVEARSKNPFAGATMQHANLITIYPEAN